MIKALVTDFSRVLLSPREVDYAGGLNALHRDLTGRGDYDFWEYFQLNEELLEFYKTLGQKIRVYMFTSEYIQEHTALQPKLERVFVKVFSAARLNIKKSDSETYRVIAEKIGIKPEEILYIDDKQSNLDCAAETGMSVLRFDSNEQVIPEIKHNLTKSLF